MENNDANDLTLRRRGVCSYVIDLLLSGIFGQYETC